MKIGTTYPAFNYDIERSFKNALGTSTELVLIKTYEDLETVNLLAFPGGEDVSPSLYSQNNIHSYGLNANRDKREDFLYKHASKLEIPMFGMCRGLQFLAVMLGQSLIQDIYSELEQIHKGTHPIDVVLPSIVSKNFATVNSLHHQGLFIEENSIQTLRNLKYHGIYVTSYHNGIVESFESKGIIATQFHPEFMFSKESEKFFTDLGEWVEKKGFTFDEKEYEKVLIPENKQKEEPVWYASASNNSSRTYTSDWASVPTDTSYAEFVNRARGARTVAPVEMASRDPNTTFTEYVRSQGRVATTEEAESSIPSTDQPWIPPSTTRLEDYFGVPDGSEGEWRSGNFIPTYTDDDTDEEEDGNE